MILSIHASKGCPFPCPSTHLSFSLGLITAYRIEPFKVFPFAIDEFQIVANPPYGSFMHYPKGLRLRRWFAHECFILVYITVAQLFGSTQWMYDYKILSAPLTLVLPCLSVCLSYVLCPFNSFSHFMKLPSCNQGISLSHGTPPTLLSFQF